MIAIARKKDNTWVRSISPYKSTRYGYHSLFGFLREDQLEERLQNRIRHGLKNGTAKWICLFEVEAISLDKWKVRATQNCSVKETKGGFELNTPVGVYSFSGVNSEQPLHIDTSRIADRGKQDDVSWKKYFFISSIFVCAVLFLPFSFWQSGPSEEKLPDPVTVQIVTPKIKKLEVKEVEIKKTEEPKPITEKKQIKSTPLKTGEVKKKKVIPQRVAAPVEPSELGFLGVAGKNEINNALRSDAPSSRRNGGGRGKRTAISADSASTEDTRAIWQGMGEGLRKSGANSQGKVTALSGGVRTKGSGGSEQGYGNVGIRAEAVQSITESISAEDLQTEGGGLDSSVVDAIILQNQNEIRSCYEQGLERNSSLHGRILIRFTIGPTGKVTKSELPQSSLRNAGVESCIRKKVLEWQFPKPVNGTVVRVTKGFLLRPPHL